MRLINARGFNGMSLQAVADEVGITQAGVLHYVGSKHGLLVEVIRRYYDRSSTLDDYLSLFHPGGAFEGQSPKIPEYCRLLVAENNNQPELVMLFQMLNPCICIKFVHMIPLAMEQLLHISVLF